MSRSHGHQRRQFPHVVEPFTTGHDQSIAIGVGGADIGQGPHAGGARRLEAGQRILDHRAGEGLLVHAERRMEKKIRERLSTRYLG